MAKYTTEDIRNGIFALNTRRFGTVAENLIKVLANASWGRNISHDLFDDKTLDRIEVKFSRALRTNPDSIRAQNILEQIVSANDKSRMFKSTEWKKYTFNWNIQQIKRHEFDILYYGIFFSDKVMVFKIHSEDIGKAIQYSDRQHKGNLGEGQFHLNNSTYEHHLNNYFEIELTYYNILKLLMRIQRSDKEKERIIRSILLIVV